MLGPRYPNSIGWDYIYDLVGKIQQVSDPTDVLPVFGRRASMIHICGNGRCMSKGDELRFPSSRDVMKDFPLFGIRL